MKPILLLLGSLVLLVLVFLSGVIITANVIAEPEPHKFAHMDTPDLWTSQPKVVDAAKQDYQRLPDASPPAAPAADAQKAPAVEQAAAVPPVDHTVTASVSPQPAVDMKPERQGDAIDPKHADWCYARYRSYRIEDNSYQPFSGGPRRQCQAPGAPTGETASAASALDRQQMPDELQRAPTEPVGVTGRQDDNAAEGYAQSQAVSDGVPAGAHEEWCYARYRSYRVDDNSYQPLTGGPRRACQSPYG